MRNNNNQLHVYLNDEEMNLIRENSILMGLTITDYVKLMCNLIPACESLEEKVSREQEELEEYEKQHICYYVNCETLEERLQREQEELNRFIEQEEIDNFENEAQRIENDFTERLKKGETTQFEKKVWNESIERDIEYYEDKIDTLKNDFIEEWEYEPFYELP